MKKILKNHTYLAIIIGVMFSLISLISKSIFSFLWLMLSLFAFKVDNLLLTSCFSLSNSIISSFKFSIFSFRLSILFLFTSFFSIKISSWSFNLFIDSSFSSFSLWILFKFSVLFSKDLLILSSSSLFFLILFKDVSFCWFNKFISSSDKARLLQKKINVYMI